MKIIKKVKKIIAPYLIAYIKITGVYLPINWPTSLPWKPPSIESLMAPASDLNNERLHG